MESSALNEFALTITNRNGNTETVIVKAESESQAVIEFRPDDDSLCRNPFVVLENTQFERQIVSVSRQTSLAHSA